MTSTELHQLLASVRPTTSEGADLLLDLRDLLTSRGHPGKCVKCFFGLLGDLDRPGALLPLRHWIESELVVSVSAGGREIDAFPVRLDRSESLEDFCHAAIDTVRHDRGFKDSRITLGFRFKEAAAA